ncbi:hypothetical protein [Egicoccus sp. AB-alg6-2]|uniref:hypothetical protein n=1 Tax=Egicoccus sp. AB-alg6-2 TaxID=3242692 RepID=UPI00359E255B
MKVLSGVLALLGVGVLLAVVLVGGGAVPAQFAAEVSADAPGTTGDGDDAAEDGALGVTDLLAELGELEAALPQDPAPSGVEFDDSATWGRLEGDAGATRAVLDPLEPRLRRLFVAADDTDTELGAAVALVARGWLDVWSGLGPLAAWEAHDLEFPNDTDDPDGVATGADELRGAAERGLEQVLVGRGRLHTGYTQLRALGPAEPDLQVALDLRAAAADDFDAEVRPLVLKLLSQATPTVLVTTERFATTSPGSQARARSSTVVCVDREALASAAGPLTPEQIDALSAATPARVDCPAPAQP